MGPPRSNDVEAPAGSEARPTPRTVSGVSPAGERTREPSEFIVRVLLEALEMRTTRTQARLVLNLARLSLPFGEVPHDDALAPFLRGAFLEAAREVMGEWLAADALSELERIFRIPELVAPLHRSRRNGTTDTSVPQACKERARPGSGSVAQARSAHARSSTEPYVRMAYLWSDHDQRATGDATTEETSVPVGVQKRR